MGPPSRPTKSRRKFELETKEQAKAERSPPAEVCWESSHGRLLRSPWADLPPCGPSADDHKCCIIPRRQATVAAPYSPEAPALEKDTVLHHDNVRPHVVQDWLAQRIIEVMPHLLYSSDLAPCDFWLFPALKKAM